MNISGTLFEFIFTSFSIISISLKLHKIYVDLSYALFIFYLYLYFKMLKFDIENKYCNEYFFSISHFIVLLTNYCKKKQHGSKYDMEK